MKPSLLPALFLITVPLLGQQQPGTVSGKVVNSVTGQPVKKAVVYLRTADGAKSYVTGSDASGKFAFDNVQPASYVATGQAEGYANFQRNGGKPVAVSAQQTVEDVEVRLAPLSVITGKVVDEDGQPIAHVSIRAMHYQYTAQGKRLQLTANGQTDDRGVYRMYDVQPGRYYLRAFAFAAGAERGANTHSTIPEEAYETNYYPGVTAISQATPQDVQPGAEWTADFKLRRLPAYHIRGHVAGVPANALGRGGNNVLAQHCDEESGTWFMPDGLQIMQEPNGRFDAFGATDGTYCVNVAQNMSAKKTVTVKGADVDGVELAVEPTFAVTGTVVFDGTPPNPLPPINVGLVSDNVMGQLRGVAKSDGTFRIDGAFPGTYSLAMPMYGTFYIKSVLFGGQDVTNGVIPNLQPETALAITMGTDPGEIDGSVQTGSLDSGMPVTIAAVPEDAFAARQDMYRFNTGPAGGSFSIANMPPGNYKVFALQAEGSDDMYNRDLLKLLESKAAPVTIHAAGHEQVSVTAISSGEIEQALKKLK